MYTVRVVAVTRNTLTRDLAVLVEKAAVGRWGASCHHKSCCVPGLRGDLGSSPDRSFR